MLQRKQLIRNLIILTVFSIIAVTSITIIEINEAEYFEKYINSCKYSDVRLSINNGLYQKINKSCTDNDVRLTVDYIVGDMKELFVFYTTENLTEAESPLEEAVDILDESGESLLKEEGLTTCPIREGSKKHLITIVNSHNSTLVLKRIKLRVDHFVTGDHKVIKGNWEVNISIKNKLMTAKPKIYSINKNIILHDLKFRIKEIRSYPTISQIIVDYSESGSKEFSFIRTYISTENKTYPKILYKDKFEIDLYNVRDKAS
jgi:hypothetical protein